MGCTSSKLDDLPAVSLCRQRCAFLDEAIHLRYALSAAHISYINSLQSISLSFHYFLQFHFAASPPPSKNPQPAVITVEPVDGSPSPPHLSHSNSGSHLHFRSDSDDDDDDGDDDDDEEEEDHQGLASFAAAGGGYMHMNYMMQNNAIPSIVYEQRPASPRTVYMGESSSFYPYPYPYPNTNPNPYYPYYGYGGGGGGSGFYGPPPPYGAELPVAASSTEPPPPPPSPPRSSGWDFLNFFNNNNNNDRYYSRQEYTPSRDSMEVREEEGIPDLEDDDDQHEEEVKQVHGDQNDQNAADDDDGAGDHSESAEEEIQEISKETSPKETRPSVSMENEGVEIEYENEGVEVEYEVHVVEDKDEVGNEEKSGEGGRPRDALEVAIEIAIQFRRAFESGAEVAKMLEVGRLPYDRKHQVSSKMLHVVAPSLSMVSQTSTAISAVTTLTANTAGHGNLSIDEDLLARSRSLSSILQKLHLWEKKLYNEVKAEEKVRIMHDWKCRKLKHLEDRGADFHKLDSTRTLIRNLSTKVRMAIEVVDKVSTTISKIRDEELWPQLNELIQRLMRMWKSMLECHRSQCEAIREAKILGSIGSRKKNGDAHLATKKLEQELINWTFQFSSWVNAQKGYVKALNNWLMKCLLYEPEETPDGIVPFSPGRIGAPPIFVICNQWSQAMEKISEKEVVDSMQVFTLNVLQIWEQDRLEVHQTTTTTTNKDLEKNIVRDDHKLQKQIQALERKMLLASGEAGSLSIPENITDDGDKGNSLQDSLQRILEAMEKFTESSARIYEELLQRSEEEIKSH